MADPRTSSSPYGGSGVSNDATHEYDGPGRPTTKDVDVSKTAYCHDACNVVAEYKEGDQLQGAVTRGVV